MASTYWAPTVCHHVLGFLETLLTTPSPVPGPGNAGRESPHGAHRWPFSPGPSAPPPVFLPLHHPPGKIPEPQFYAEPHTYEEPGRAGRGFTREIEASRIHIEKIIGSGELQGL